MLTVRRMLVWVCLAFTLVGASCSGNGTTQILPGEADNPELSRPGKTEDGGGLFPALPRPVDLVRSLSATGTNQLDGAQFNASWPHNNLVVVSGVTGRYTPTWLDAHHSTQAGLAFGLYQFDLTGHDGSMLPLKMEWTTAPADGSIYAGLANFAAGRWDWFPFSPAGALEISDLASYTSGEQLVLCVMVTGTLSGDLHQLSLGDSPEANAAPVAIIMTANSLLVAGGQAAFDGTDSYDPDGTVVQYDWDLNGDGVFELLLGPGQVNHIYDTKGTYDVGLRVTDNHGEEIVRHATVVVYDPVDGYDETETNDAAEVSAWVQVADKLPAPDFTGFRGSLGLGGYDGGRADYYLIRVPKAGRLTLDMLFSDEQADLDMRLLKLNADGVTTTTLMSSTSTTDNEEIALNFTEPGEYYWYCYVFSSAPSDAVADYTLAAAFETSDPPVADLQATPTSGDWPLTVNFDASGSADPDGTIAKYDYDWDGNGTYDSLDAGPTPVHEYSTVAGELNATVRVTDDFGLTDTASILITVINELPVAAFTMDPASGARPLTVNFDATASHDPDGAITKYEWDFDGDGVYDLSKTGTSTEPALAAAVYYALGTFNATLRVTDDTGQTQTVAHQVTVTGAADNEIEPNNDEDTANTAADAAAANSLPAFPIAAYFGQVGPKADTVGGDPGDPDDWYVFTVNTAGDMDLILDIFDAVCDIDFKLYAEGDLTNTVGTSTGTGDQEQITVTLDPGTYYLRVYAYTSFPAWGGYRLSGTFTP